MKVIWRVCMLMDINMQFGNKLELKQLELARVFA